MKPFNLKEALAGKPVVMRNGKKVDTIYYLKEKQGQQVAVFIEDDKIETWHNENGSFFYDNNISEYDLFMYEEPVKLFLNIYKSNTGRYYSGMIHKDAKEALENRNNQEFFKTIEITI